METRIICIYTPLKDSYKDNFYGFHTVETTVEWREVRDAMADFIREDIGVDVWEQLHKWAPTYIDRLESAFRQFLGNNNATIRPLWNFEGYKIEVLFLGI